MCGSDQKVQLSFLEWRYYALMPFFNNLRGFYVNYEFVKRAL
jgi:hypothetical protein